MPARVQPKIRPEQVIEGVSAQRRPAPLPAPPRRSPGRALSRRGREGWKPSSRHLLKPPPHPRSLRAAERVFQPRGRLCARGRLRAAAGAGLLGGGAHGAQAAHRLLPRLSAPGRQPQKARFPSLFLSLSHYLALGARGPPKREAARWEGETAFARSTKALVKLAQVGQQILKQVVPNMRRYGKWAVVTGATANSKASSTKHAQVWQVGGGVPARQQILKQVVQNKTQVWQVGGGVPARQQILKQVVQNMRRYGKWAVVTGATDGIGKALAEASCLSFFPCPFPRPFPAPFPFSLSLHFPAPLSCCRATDGIGKALAEARFPAACFAFFSAAFSLFSFPLSCCRAPPVSTSRLAPILSCFDVEMCPAHD